MPRPRITRRVFFTLILIMLSFAAFNFNAQLAASFGIMTFLIFAHFFFDKSTAYPLVKKNFNIFTSLAIGLGTYFLFIFLQIIIDRFIDFIPGTANFNSVVQFLSVQLFSGAGAFAENVAVIFFVFAVIIPMIETPVFNGVLLEGLLDISGLRKIKFWSLTAHIIAIMTGAVAAIFHATARLGAGAEGISSALITVLIFFYISSLVVIATGHILPAIILHIIANAIAVGVRFNLFAGLLTAIFFGGVIALVFLFVTKKIQLRNIIPLGG